MSPGYRGQPPGGPPGAYAPPGGPGGPDRTAVQPNARPAYGPGPGGGPGYPPGPGHGYAPGPGGPPGYPPPPGVWGPHPQAGYPGMRPPGAAGFRHLPGAGLAVGLVGLALLALSLTSLPWVSGGGQDVSFSDIRDAVEAAEDGAVLTPAGPAPGASPDLPSGAEVPPGALEPSGTPAPGLGLTGTPRQSAGGTTSDVAQEYIEVYAETGWIVTLGLAAAAVLFSTLLVPASHGGRVVTGFFTAGLIGLLINLADREGVSGHRISAALATLVAGAAFGMAYWSFFGQEHSPDPAYGLWAGATGLVAVLVGCVMGTRRVPA